MAADKSEGPVIALVYLSIAWRVTVNYGSLTASFRGLRLFSSNGELREYAAAENWNHCEPCMQCSASREVILTQVDRLAPQDRLMGTV